MNLLSREQKIRQKRIEQRAGKALIFDEPKILDLITNRKVPAQMQHCIIKVQKKMDGTKKEAFISAFNICQSVFQNYGYQVPQTTTLTANGLKNNMRHRREIGNSSKESNFRSMTEWFKKEMNQKQRLEDEDAKKTNQMAEKEMADEARKKLASGKKVTQREREAINKYPAKNKIVSKKTTKKT
jgi:hypothetical protein